MSPETLEAFLPINLFLSFFCSTCFLEISTLQGEHASTPDYVWDWYEATRAQPYRIYGDYERHWYDIPTTPLRHTYDIGKTNLGILFKEKV